ncbi:hypothetical protein JNW90_29710 [Micromonospora sp. STR1s_5]|nr:hypothetical protein [Micromonospora sp. STR1s_5]
MYCSILLTSARSWPSNFAADDVKAHTSSDTSDLSVTGVSRPADAGTAKPKPIDGQPQQPPS